MLFRYPYDENPAIYDDSHQNLQTSDSINEPDRLQLRNIINENDEALCNMFSVNPNLCGQKFEIKINSVRHVGHPMSLLQPPPPPALNQSMTASTNQRQFAHHQPVNFSLSSYDCLTAPNQSSNNLAQSANTTSSNRGDVTSFNIVCSLRSSASYDIVDCYHDLSKRLAIALSFEERRGNYLSNEIKTILATFDERDMANLVNLRDDQASPQTQSHSLNKNFSATNISDSMNNGLTNANSNSHLVDDTRGQENENQKSIFSLILSRSNLAKDLRRVFISLSTTGLVDLKINNWVSVSFCLPQKVHRLKLLTHKSMPAIGTKDIKRCLLYLRPYHGLLLLYEQQELLDSLPIDASPAFIQLIKVTKANKNFMDLSVDANLTLMQIFSIVSQLIYWAKATVIYPICDSNIYAIHPLASTGLQSKLVNDFKTRFPTS